MSLSERTNLSHALKFMRHFLRHFVIKVSHREMPRAITTALRFLLIYADLLVYCLRNAGYLYW